MTRFIFHFVLTRPIATLEWRQEQQLQQQQQQHVIEFFHSVLNSYTRSTGWNHSEALSIRTTAFVGGVRSRVMWAFAMGPAVAAGVAFVLFGWKRRSVVLRASGGATAMAMLPASSVASAVNSAAAGKTPTVNGLPRPSTNQGSKTQEARRTDETCHWLRRIASTPVVCNAAAKMFQLAATRNLVSALDSLRDKTRGRVTHTSVSVEVVSLIPEILPTTCEAENVRDEWIDVEASCACECTVTIDFELVLVRNLTLPVTIRLSRLKVAGAVARCYTRGAQQGSVCVVDVPDVGFELNTTVGHNGAYLSVTDCGAVPWVFEKVACTKIRAFVGRVFADALKRTVQRLLPESLR